LAIADVRVGLRMHLNRCTVVTCAWFGGSPWIVRQARGHWFESSIAHHPSTHSSATPARTPSPTVSRVAPDRTGSSTPHRLCPLGLERLVPNHTLAAVAGAYAKGIGLGINHPGLVVEGQALKSRFRRNRKRQVQHPTRSWRGEVDLHIPAHQQVASVHTQES
jgi:hypothetical protein